jgi:hypothetical protein
MELSDSYIPIQEKMFLGDGENEGGILILFFFSLFAISAAHLYFVTTSGELRSSSFSSLFSSSDIAAFSLSLQKTKIKQKSIPLHHRLVVRNCDRRNQMGGLVLNSCTRFTSPNNTDSYQLSARERERERERGESERERKRRESERRPN